MLMICGTDLSSASAEALGAAVAVAARRGEPRVLLAYVVEPGVAEASADELAAAVAAVQPAATAGGVTIENRVIRGDTATSLVALARSEHADMIVIGARGPAADSNADDERPPGVADRLAQITPVPVVVVRSAAPFRAWAAGTARLRAFLGADPSHTSAIAMAWAKQLVGRGGVDVVLGSIFYADEAGKQYGVRTTSMVDDDPELVRLINRDALRRWSAQAASAPGDGTVGAKARHGLGRIGDHLLELADADVTDIIIVGASQRTGLSGFGSVSSVVVHNATQSVVCVPACAKATITVPMVRIAVVATDGSDFANRAIPYAFALTQGSGQGEGCEVHIVRALDDDQDVATIETQLRSLIPTGLPQKVEVHAVRGADPADAIATSAARLGADVICIASHGRSGISRALVGSVADKLLRSTRVPVLLLRP